LIELLVGVEGLRLSIWVLTCLCCELLSLWLGEAAVLVWRSDAVLSATSAVAVCRVSVRVLAFVAVGWPVDSITEGLSTSPEHGERPQESVNSEDLLPVALGSNVVQTLVSFVLHLKVLDRRLVVQSELDVELEEHRHQHSDDSVHDEGKLKDQVVLNNVFVVLLLRVVIDIDSPGDAIEPGGEHGENVEVCHDENVDKQKDEELAVPEANTVVDPGAMMVHVEHAAVAG